ncbi:MAG: discoidin domain-containing protein, partial [Solirubrobacterales bacterium]
TSDLDKRPVARQMRRSLLDYMAGKQFAPEVSLTIQQLDALFTEPSPLQKLGATAAADNHHPSHTPDLAIDGNPSTIWHTNWEPMAQPPHYLALDLKKLVRVRGLTYLPRQDMTNGRIARFELYASVDGQRWGQPLASGQWPDDALLKTIRLNEAVEARFVKLVALSEVQGRPFASAAEVNVLVE